MTFHNNGCSIVGYLPGSAARQLPVIKKGIYNVNDMVVRPEWARSWELR